jgi:hypothetical protein
MDGIEIGHEALLFPRAFFRQQDLSQAWDLGRRYDIVLCLEVGEHLAAESAPLLVHNLTAHSDVVAFSAACPGQPGQHHINCQWPEYWQSLFNARGYICKDSIRWKMWNIELIEPWYRQNMFIASGAGHGAGKEPRIKSVIHPEMLRIMSDGEWGRRMELIETGHQSLKWYVTTPIKGCAGKIRRKVRSVVRR